MRDVERTITRGSKPFHNVSWRFLLMSFMMIAIGILTMTYHETILFNSFWIGLSQAVAGVMGALVCLHILKLRRFVNNYTMAAIIYRVGSYLCDIVFNGYRPNLVVGALIWIMIFVGFVASNKFIDAFDLLEVEKQLHEKRIEHELQMRKHKEAQRVLEKGK